MIGEFIFVYGLFEFNVGGDLVSVEIWVELDGDIVVINGVKWWCIGVDFVDYIYCFMCFGLVEDCYKNLLFVLIFMDVDGMLMMLIEYVNLCYMFFLDVYFDNVCVFVDCIVGGWDYWNKGWK